MITLLGRPWGKFYIDDIFNISSGKRLTKKEMLPGKTPFIGATDSGNGITNYIANTNLSLDANVLGVNYNGNGVTISFYHLYECMFTDDVKRFHLKNHPDNKYIYLFMKTVIVQQKSKYMYAYKFNEERMKRQIIMLPVNDKNEPDYKFMEEYMKKYEINLQKNYLSYKKSELDLLDYKHIDLLGNKIWKEFFIGGDDGVFQISSTSSGIDKNKLILKDENPSNNKMPYITRTDENNGINMFISEEQNKKYKMDKENCITIGLDTQTVFYQSHKFYTGQNVQILTNERLNKYNALFIIPLLKIQMNKFNWGGNGATLGRLNRTKIMLPIDDKEEPDYDYMGKYIKNLMKKKFDEYHSFIAEKQRLTKK